MDHAFNGYDEDQCGWGFHPQFGDCCCRRGNQRSFRPEEAEAVACREGIVLAARWPDVPMMLETDCAVVAAKLKSNVQDRSIGWSLIREARMAMEDLCRLEIAKISRSQNNVAHELAHFAIKSGRSEVFFFLFLILFCLWSVMILFDW